MDWAHRPDTFHVNIFAPILSLIELMLLSMECKLQEMNPFFNVIKDWV